MAQEENNRLQVLKTALRQVAQQQPLSQDLIKALSPTALKLLLRMVQQLKAQGLAGPHTRTPERLLAMYKLINQRTGGQPTEPTADQIIQQMTPQARDQILGMESLLARQSNAQAMVDSSRLLGSLRR